MILDLTNFTHQNTLTLSGLEKRAVLDDREKGEIGLEQFNDIAHIGDHLFFKKEITATELTDLVVEYVRNELGSDRIDKSWFMITDNRIVLSISENAAGEPIDDVTKHWDEGKDVYSCFYDFKLSINGISLKEADLAELFEFER